MLRRRGEYVSINVLFMYNEVVKDEDVLTVFTALCGNRVRKSCSKTVETVFFG
jgi:hypothetical protein